MRISQVAIEIIHPVNKIDAKRSTQQFKCIADARGLREYFTSKPVADIELIEQKKITPL